MGFLDEEFKPNTLGNVPIVEFATTKIPQNSSKAISVTTNSWDRYQKRKEIVENISMDLLAIMHGMHQDGYISRTVSKYVNSIFLRGYKNVTLKPAIEKYLKYRLQMIVDAMPDHNHIDDFFQSIARDMVAFANSYIVKIRQSQKYLPGGIKINGLPHLKPNGDKEQQDPIVAYEIIHPASMHVIRDLSGNVIRYEQWPLMEYSIKNQKPQDPKLIRKWDRDQVIHIVIDRDSGFAYGTPFLSAVLDDIRLLRTLEDHVSRLAFRFAFPFTQVKVGDTKPGFEASEEELEFYKKMVTNAPPDATLVTNEKVAFDIVGAQGQAIQLEPYLEHFQNRAFSGLGVSGVSMGMGDTSNRSTADAMTTEMHDQIKHFQNVFSRNINQEIYRELLAEGGFDWYNDPDKNWCHLVFEEIEVENKIRQEAHALSLLQANAITFDEFRNSIGKQPFSNKEWDDTYLPKFLLPQVFAKLTGAEDLDEHGELLLQKHKSDMKIADATHQNLKKDLEVKDATIQATKASADSQASQAGAHQTVTTGQTVASIPGGGRKVSTTKTVKTPVTAPKGHFAGGGTQGPAAAPKSTAKGNDNKLRPANQHGKRTAPKKAREDVEVPEEVILEITSNTIDLSSRVLSFEKDLKGLYLELNESIIEQAHLNVGKALDNSQLVQLLFELTRNRLSTLSAKYLMPSFYQGTAGFYEDAGINPKNTMWINERSAIIEFNERTINRLISDLVKPITKLIKKTEDEDTDRLDKNIQEIFDSIEYRLSFIAYTEIPQSYWFGYASAAHIHQVELDLVPEEGACEDCSSKPVQWKNCSSARKRLAQAPTIHPNCTCGLSIRLIGNQEKESEIT